jgi:hypothetical protein
MNFQREVSVKRGLFPTRARFDKVPSVESSSCLPINGPGGIRTHDTREGIAVFEANIAKAGIFP